MADTCPVVRIVSDNPAHEGGFIEINASDFDPAKHVKYDEAAKPAAAPKPNRKERN